MPHMELCRNCQRCIVVNRESRHHLCRQCEHDRRYPPPPSDNKESESEASPTLFDGDPSALTTTPTI